MNSLAEKLQRSSVPRITHTQIICGDCAGDDLLPSKTLLLADDTCSRCGGSNYVLASTLCSALALHILHGDKNEKRTDT